MKNLCRLPTALLLLLAGLVNIAESSIAEELSDGLGGVFDVTQHDISLEEIQEGGPPRDGIPALTDPEFVWAEDADFLLSWDRVLGVVHDGVAKAYPIKILNWHEVVNDTVAGKPITVSW